MTTIPQFCRKHSISAQVRDVDSNPQMSDMMPGSRHFRVTLRRSGKQMTVPFSQGPAIEQEPTAEDVLSCLAMDAAGYENARSFEDWASEYGYDTDSRRAKKTYKAVERQHDQLERFLPSDIYQTLLWDTEGL